MNGSAATDRRKIVVLGQTPPPYHGQAIAIGMMLAGDYQHVEMRHVRMGFSSEVREVGKFRAGKLLELGSVVLVGIWARVRFGRCDLYYPPGGAKRAPVLRDLVILNCLRPFFSRTIFHFHADGVSDYYGKLGSGLMRWLFRRAYFGADLAIKVSEGSRVDLRLLEAKRTEVVLNAVENPMEVESERGEGALCRLLFVGSVIESKGVSVLLEAFKRLKELGNGGLELHVVGRCGNEDYRGRLEREVEESGFAPDVVLHGEKTGEEKARLYAGCDVFCFPTFYSEETFGLVVAEAMSYGIPVVATRWKGMPEVVAEGETGFLVEPRDAAELAERIGELIADETLRRKMGEAGKSRYREFFSLETYYRRMDEVLR